MSFETIHTLGFALFMYGFPYNTATLKIYFHISHMKFGLYANKTLSQHIVKTKQQIFIPTHKIA